MPQREHQQTVLELLKDISSLDPLKELFWSEVNYEWVATLYSITSGGEAFCNSTRLREFLKE